jgi:hypothetical protein
MLMDCLAVKPSDATPLPPATRRCRRSARKLGAEFRLNTNTFLDQTHPRVAGLDNGSFVGAWNSDNQDGDYAQRYLSNGAKTGLEFRANSETSSMQFGAAIAALTNSRSVIVWYSFGQDGSGFGVYAQRYTKTGAENGGEFRATVSTAGDQLNPAIAGLSNGGFVVVWEAASKDGDGKAVVARQYKSDNARWGEFKVNTFTTNDQITPAVALLGNGRFVVVWVSVNQDGSGYGVYAQRFGRNRDPRHRPRTDLPFISEK